MQGAAERTIFLFIFVCSLWFCRLFSLGRTAIQQAKHYVCCVLCMDMGGGRGWLARVFIHCIATAINHTYN